MVSRRATAARKRSGPLALGACSSGGLRSSDIPSPPCDGADIPRDHPSRAASLGWLGPRSGRGDGYRMNGEPLTLAHGAPLRLVVARWAGDHWMKWLRRVRLQPAKAEGFYMQTAYKMPARPVAPGTAV